MLWLLVTHQFYTNVNQRHGYSFLSPSVMKPSLTTVMCTCACVSLIRTGEFRVEVTVSNLVSSASLSSHIFVVDRPCQPPPVKNMGPLKLQVRHQQGCSLHFNTQEEYGKKTQKTLLPPSRCGGMRSSVWG